jgi:hypothetical protein
MKRSKISKRIAERIASHLFRRKRVRVELTSDTRDAACRFRGAEGTEINRMCRARWYLIAKPQLGDNLTR